MCKNYLKFIRLIIIILLLLSCKSKEKLKSGGGVSDMNKEILIENIIKNQIDFNSLYFKKINIDLDNNGKTNSIKANMYIDKDKQIIIQVMLLIEIAKISIEPNQITILNRIEREYYSTDFDYINKKFHINMDFNLLQSLLTNTLFFFPLNEPKMQQNYKIEENNSNITLKSSIQSTNNHQINADNFTHEIDILQNDFKIIRHLIYDLSGISVDINYNNFNYLEQKKFPYFLSLKAKNRSEKFEVSIKYSNIDINGEEKLSFSIPSNYSKGFFTF